MLAIGIITIDFQIPGSLCLKDKRMVLRSIKDRLRNNFNISISEVANQDKWQLSTLGIASVSNNKKHVDSTLNKIRDFFENERRIIVTDYQMEML